MKSFKDPFKECKPFHCKTNFFFFNSSEKLINTSSLFLKFFPLKEEQVTPGCKISAVTIEKFKDQKMGTISLWCVVNIVTVA